VSTIEAQTHRQNKKAKTQEFCVSVVCSSCDYMVRTTRVPAIMS
jgi:hypothetical protein